ncbi:ABC transporter substrate-binding protein [Flagellimonas beolgyonensis]|uniref:ABC transporter substrate-binding protein n=1 Tax=Flagellimonas beolgyonensis TaxID=864064 RepID=UPI000F8DF242|nr:ABC transporter substrate-binding protein [Allomuricauda beolgyonensis]
MAALRNYFYALLGAILLLTFSCKEQNKPLEPSLEPTDSVVHHATGFNVVHYPNYTELEVLSPWPGAEKKYRYALVPKEKLASITLPSDRFDAIVGTPVEKIVVTSTTHIAPIETLGELDAIVGFPHTDYISSPNARKRIADGHIKNLGMNELLNTEMVLLLNPEMVVGFSISEVNSAYDMIQRAGMPVVYNGDWAEQTPLGKAEWIKFFAPFFQKEQMADSIFNKIEDSYNQAKALALKAKTKPTVFTGGLYKDVWYVAGGNSWMAQFLKDANADYLWGDTAETGSIGLGLESVLDKAQHADYWFNPSSQISYDELAEVNAHHTQFDAFTTRKIYSNAIEKGATGGIVFYEMAPQRPDLVLKDFIAILHPELLPNHTLHFIKPLN